jgi:pimeloyl-ACP methyl ester carboxylesterase
MHKSFTFLVFLLCFSTLSSQSITGDWYGTLDAMGTKLPIVLHFQDDGGKLSGTMDSPSQGAYGLEMNKVSFQKNQLGFELKMLGAKYSGTLSQLGLSGNFNQAGFDFDLDFGRTPPSANGEKKREQEPNDFPYLREEVTFAGGAENVIIAGELTLPSDGKVKQAVILVSGSGGQDRNSELGTGINHRPFLVLSDFLTRQGIAVLRYDDRGISKSTGYFNAATSVDFSEDAAAALTYLKSRDELKKAKVGIIGHSEGGLIASMVAAQGVELDFLVLLAAPGIPIDSLMLMQTKLIQTSMGAPDVVVERNLAPVRKAYTYIKQHPDQTQDEIDAGLVKIYKASITDLPAPLQRSIGDQDAFARSQIGGLSSKWFRYFLSFDPAVYLEQVTVPVLALNGEFDLQVPMQENLDGIARSIGSNGNKELTVVPLPGLNHLFQTTTTGSPNEYGQIEETFSPTAMRIIAGWIAKR